MKVMLNNYIAKFNSFFYFFIWGFYYSAGYFFCNKIYKLFNNEYSYKYSYSMPYYTQL